MDRLLTEQERKQTCSDVCGEDRCNGCENYILVRKQDAKTSKWWIEQVERMLQNIPRPLTKEILQFDLAITKAWQQLKESVE